MFGVVIGGVLLASIIGGAAVYARIGRFGRGNDAEEMTRIADSMNGIGYKVQISYVELDPKIAYERHIKAVKEDSSYISSYFFKDSHVNWILANGNTV